MTTNHRKRHHRSWLWNCSSSAACVQYLFSFIFSCHCHGRTFGNGWENQDHCTWLCVCVCVILQTFSFDWLCVIVSFTRQKKKLQFFTQATIAYECKSFYFRWKIGSFSFLFFFREHATDVTCLLYKESEKSKVNWRKKEAWGRRRSSEQAKLISIQINPFGMKKVLWTGTHLTDWCEWQAVAIKLYTVCRSQSEPTVFVFLVNLALYILYEKLLQEDNAKLSTTSRNPWFKSLRRTCMWSLIKKCTSQTYWNQDDDELERPERAWNCKPRLFLDSSTVDRSHKA